MSDIFDPDTFLDGTLPGSNSTKKELPPPGVYPAHISKIEVRNGTVKKEGANFGKTWVALNITWTIENHAVNSQLDQPKVNVFDSVMLDLDDSGQVSMGKGKNTRLGRLREAIGMNTGPARFRAFEGRPAQIKVDPDEYNGEPTVKVSAYAKP